MAKTNKEQQEQELKRLSKKYFWEQKFTETFLFVLIILGILGALYISGSIMKMLNPEEFGDANIFLVGLLGLMLLAVTCLMIFLIGILIYLPLREWIKSNKEEARRKAKQELGIKIDEYNDY